MIDFGVVAPHARSSRLRSITSRAPDAGLSRFWSSWSDLCHDRTIWARLTLWGAYASTSPVSPPTHGVQFRLMGPTTPLRSARTGVEA
jgi:hypothetical protein